MTTQLSKRIVQGESDSVQEPENVKLSGFGLGQSEIEGNSGQGCGNKSVMIKSISAELRPESESVEQVAELNSSSSLS